MKPIFLYVISASEEGPVKLGISIHPEKRLKQLQTGHAQKLRLFHTEAVNKSNGRLFEGLLHKDINHLRTHGEWFDLNVENAIGHLRFTLIEYDTSDLV
jgi:hypothetical protein